ncbi:MraY family glycosyltransferase [Paraherbaspirillum soli]|uniref:Glycosyltransferase n=1 Tax=Paraherbaspirillum soli TaxID=631222 RepID=A0ABW0M920_9BURK
MLASQVIKIAVVAAFVSFTVCVLIVGSQRWHGKLTLDHDLDGIQKYHTTAVPRVGGFAVVAGIICTLLFFIIIYPGQIATLHANSAMKLLIASLPAVVAGITEDLIKGVSVKVRLTATISSALIASALLGATVQHLDIWGIDSLLVFMPFALVVTAIVVAGGANAINIIDGFNGLSGSVIAIISAALGFLAWQAGDVLVATLAVLSLGVAVGFLLVNYPTGKLFLGDGGAYFLGFWVSEIAVLLLVRNPSVNAWQVLSICAYPVIEVLYSIYRRKFIGRSSPCEADGSHLHTLVYRRVAVKLIPYNAAPAWIRNAAVACVMVPCIGLIVLISVIAGGRMIGGLLLVFAQVLLYVVIYKRLARGYWRRRHATSVAVDIDTNGELS